MQIKVLDFLFEFLSFGRDTETFFIPTGLGKQRQCQQRDDRINTSAAGHFSKPLLEMHTFFCFNHPLARRLRRCNRFIVGKRILERKTLKSHFGIAQLSAAAPTVSTSCLRISWKMELKVKWSKAKTGCWVNTMSKYGVLNIFHKHDPIVEKD